MDHDLSLTPELYAAALVGMATNDGQMLRERFEKAGGTLGGPQTLSEERWFYAMQEILRAHFCLASLRIIAELHDTGAANEFGAQMLTSLEECDDAV